MSTTRAQLILVQHKKQKREKDCETRKETNFLRCFCLRPPKTRKNMGTENCDQRTHRRPKETQATKGQDGHVSNLSLLLSLLLSLSLLCRVCIFYSRFFFQEEKKTQNHPSEEGAENPPSFAFLFSVCALEMVVLFHQSARGRRTQASSAQGRKTNKQRTRVKQKISKSATRGIFQRAKSGRGDFRGFLASFVHKKLKGREQHETSLLVIRIR